MLRRRNNAAEDDDVTDGDAIVNVDVAYSKPAASDDDDSSSLFYAHNQRSPPYVTIFFTLLLLVLGTACLILFGINVTGILSGLSEEECHWSLLVLGLLTGIPGAYYGCIVLLVIFKKPGWSWTDLP